MQAWTLLPIMACGLLTLCPQGSTTSMGHPLPKPLQGPNTPHPSVSHTPLSGPEKASPAASDDYDDYYEDYYDNFQTTESPRSVSPGSLTPFCAYDRCKHLQVPCAELSRLSKCLCPGVTGPDVLPDAPRLRAVHVSETRANLHWCAPSSTVQKYHLKYQIPGEDFISGPPLNNTVRVTVLSDLIPGTEYLLCVVAANRAGFSPTDDGVREHGLCRRVRTPAHQMTYVYIAVGLASVVILGVVSVLLWRFYIRKAKPIQHGSLDNILDGELSSGHAGATNSSFRTEEQL
ncbi:LRRN4 C-terminal-like protein [Pantherophis guttatus]|uniref:LRRN4 C-terminal-like protein n=1 Tax=Pantherophis guttatus TaxID=94885 RepID=A0A6P9B7B8_PANGU|nr:LRRN4 C-terminal-like protein [Pantherophis guttatus]XP_034263910.2 LRRN4 C-terminal-like protein [Pantherophis guttatus]